MKNLIIVAIIILLIIGTITGLSITVANLKADNQPLIDENYRLKERLLIADFSNGTSSISLKDNDVIIEDLNEQLDKWKLEQLSVEEITDILVYSVLYVHVLQVRMAENGLDYPEFVIEVFANDILKERENY